jgi:hypothetical protein
MPSPLLLLVPHVLAQEPSPEVAPTPVEASAPVEAPAPTVEAPSVELAPEVAPAVPCPVDESSEALLQTLLLLLAQETGAMAAEHLGTLGDERAVAPLVHTARTREPGVARAACRALAHYPQALPSLVALASDGKLPDEVQIEAVNAIGVFGTPEAGDALVGLMREGDLPRAVRAAVLITVRTRFPERAAEIEGQVSQRGTGWLMVGGAGGLGYGLASVGYYGQADLEGLGAATGALAGGSLGFVAGRYWPIEAGEAAFLSMSGLIGTTGGLLVGCGVGEDTACWNGGLLGEAAGFGLGFALKGRRTRRQGETVEALVLSAATGLAAGTGVNYGIARAYRTEEDGWERAAHGGQIATGLGLVGGFAAGEALAPHVDLTGSDIGMMTLGSVWGGEIGGLVLGGDSHGETVPTGAGLGALTAYGLATPMELGGDAVFTGYVGLGYGSMVGLGGGLLLGEVIDVPGDTGKSLLKTAVGVGGTAGMGLGSFLAHRNPAGIRGNDVVFTVLTTGWATWQAAGWVEYADNEHVLGLIPLVPAAVGTASAIASPKIDIGVGDTLAATSLGCWGVYLGAVGGTLADTQEPLLPTLIASDVGLGAGVALLSPLVDASPVVVGMADAGGVVGATTGAVVAALVTGQRDPILVASLVGAGAGALGGGIAGVALDRRERRHARLLLPHPRLDLPGTWSFSPAAVSDGRETVPGAVLQVTDW